MAKRTAFALGGGLLGAIWAGMLRALLEAGIRPDLIVDTSVCALNGLIVASRPDLVAIDELERLWQSAATDGDVYAEGPIRQKHRAVAAATHLHSVQRGAAAWRSSTPASPSPICP